MQFLEVIDSTQLSLKSAKCWFAYKELKFLGHVVSFQGIHPDLVKTAVVVTFLTPNNNSTACHFLGLCTYYRHFVENFSGIAEPSTRLLKKDVQFIWGRKECAAFDKLQSRLLGSPVLGHFGEDGDFELYADASNMGFAVVLVLWEDNAEEVIAYVSLTLPCTEAN